ncbi:MAG: hypothetical protein U9P49_01185 [Thermodesulfobacteriota bacterium]|nr:hypothetical protein [Thermodesulfobacteriota bacterium]
MKILMAYFSRTGYTEQLAKAISNELETRGHGVEFEIIKPAVYYSWFREVARDFPRYPSIAAGLLIPAWREHHLKTYNQVEEDIQGLKYQDISTFDRICVGGPKWAHISYPVARYLQTVRGVKEKKIGVFATSAGPPLKIFEMELIFRPMSRLIERMGGDVVTSLIISSAYHDAGIMPLFQLVSYLRFYKSVENFKLGTEYANKGIMNFCNDLEQ